MFTVLDEPSFVLDDDLPLVDESLIDTVLDTVLEEETTLQTAVPLPDPVDISWYMELRPSSFCRRVDWRWRVASRLSQGATVPRSWVDQRIVAARAFQSLLIDANETDLESLSAAAPGLFAAHSLYRRGPDLVRFEVEARILAREPFDSIARKCCLTSRAIAAYEALFFNVLDRLDSTSYITHTVIGPKLHYGLKPSDIDVLWKFYGYHGGSHVLDRA